MGVSMPGGRNSNGGIEIQAAGPVNLDRPIEVL
jgi:hypothetical protein